MAFVTGVFAGPYINYWIMAIAAMVFLMLISVWWNDKRLVLAGFLGLAALVGAVRHSAWGVHRDLERRPPAVGQRDLPVALAPQASSEGERGLSGHIL